jgi:hypothetical protein
MAREGFRVAAEAQGLADAIKTLGKVDKELKKELVTSMKKAADPLVAEARSMVPATKPLTNWGQWKGGWNSGKVTRGIKVSQRNTAQRGSSGKKEETIRLLPWYPPRPLVRSSTWRAVLEAPAVAPKVPNGASR